VKPETAPHRSPDNIGLKACAGTHSGANTMSGDGAIIGVSDHGGWAVLVTVASDGTLLDRRRVELVDEDCRRSRTTAKRRRFRSMRQLRWWSACGRRRNGTRSSAWTPSSLQRQRERRD